MFYTDWIIGKVLSDLNRFTDKRVFLSAGIVAIIASCVFAFALYLEITFGWSSWAIILTAVLGVLSLIGIGYTVFLFQGIKQIVNTQKRNWGLMNSILEPWRQIINSLMKYPE